MNFHAPGDVAFAEQVQSHAGPSFHAPREVAFAEQVQSHAGSKINPAGLSIAPVDPLQSHAGSKISRHSIDTAVPVERQDQDAIARDVHHALTTAGYRAHEA